MGLAVLATSAADGVVAALLLVAAAAAAGTFVAARRTAAAAEEAVRVQREHRGAVARLGEALAASDDRGAVVDAVLDATSTLYGADTAVFWIDTGPSVVARRVVGESVGEERRLARGEGLAGWVADRLEPALWPGGPVAPSATEPTATSALAVPILARTRLYGVMGLYRRRRPAFTEGELVDLAGVAGHVGAALDTSLLHEDARRQSLTDGLTGLWNRRQFELRGAQELERSMRFGERFSVVLIDLDDFKAINDGYGHAAGDAVLVEAARRLDAAVREVDLVARYGGEEFVLLLPRTELEGAALVADKIRREVAATPVVTDAGTLRVTLSAGVASHPAHGGLASLVEHADRALYAAKSAGKNCVRSAPVPGGP